jgi:hypothetical protein
MTTPEQEDFLNILDGNSNGNSNGNSGGADKPEQIPEDPNLVKISKLKKELKEIANIIDECVQCGIVGFSVGCQRHSKEVSRYKELNQEIADLLSS